MEVLTHVAAILIGVLVTLFLVGGLSSKSSSEALDKSRKPPATGTGSTTSSSAATKKKKKNKKKAKSADSNGTEATTAAATAKSAPAPTPEPVKAPTPAPAATGGKSKKKAKKKNATTKVAPAPSPAPAPVAAPVAAPAPAPAPAPVIEEEWSSVPSTKSKRKKKKPTAAAAAAIAATPVLAPTPVVGLNPVKATDTPAAASTTDDTPTPAAPAPVESMTVSVDPKKVGIIIGPKGATMMAIQEATGTKLDISAPSKEDLAKATTKSTSGPRFLAAAAGSGGPPKAAAAAARATAKVIVAGGDAAGRKAAQKAIQELATKGYASLLQGEDFTEQSISVHPKFLSEIVGPGGRTIKALQETLQVKVTIPSTDWKPNAIQVGQIKLAKVGIAGPKDGIQQTKDVIRALMQWHHHEVTHPGMIHELIHVPPEFFHCVIGPRGSEIKHIRGNFKVDIYIPKDGDDQTDVIVVGKQSNVDKSIAYIQVLMERDAEQRERKYNDEFYG